MKKRIFEGIKKYKPMNTEVVAFFREHVGIRLGEEQSVLERIYSLYSLQVKKKLLTITTS